METFSFYPNRKIKLSNKTLTIEPYRVAEVRDYVAPMDEIQVKLSSIVSRLELYTNKEEMTPVEIEEVSELAREANNLKLDAMTITVKLAQLGLKRSVYPDAMDKVGQELDEYPDIGISESTASKVVGVMMQLANKDIPQVADTKKALQERLQRKSGKDTIDGSSE